MSRKQSSGIGRGKGKRAAKAKAVAKTIAEANQIAVDLGLAKNADFTGLDVSVANEMMSELDATYKMFPDLPHLDFIGSIQAGINWSHDEVQKEKFLINADFYRGLYPGLSDKEIIARIPVRKHRAGRANAWFVDGDYSSGHYDVQHIGFNARHFSSAVLQETLGKVATLKATLPGQVKMRWSPEGCHTPKSIMSHEIGHYLDYHLNLSSDTEILGLFSLYRGKNTYGIDEHGFFRYSGKMANALSAYANTNHGEFIAEAWAEYRNNPNSRPLAKQVGDRILEIYRGRHP